MKLKDLKPVYIKGKPPKIKEGEFLLPYLTPEYIRSGATPEFYPKQEGIALVEDGDLILLWDGSNAGEFFKGKRGILSSTMVKIAPIVGTDDNYIFYSLKLQEPSLKSKTAGSGIPHVDKEALFNLEVFLPEKTEQSTIATILTTIDQAIEKTERLIAKYERIKTGLMQDLLTRGIDEQGRIRSEETHEFKDSALGRIPVEWEVKKLGDCCSQKVAYGVNAAAVPYTFELPTYLRITDIDESGTFIDEGKMSVVSKEWQSYLLNEDDVVFARTGNTTGKTYYHSGLLKNLVFAGFLVRAKTLKSTLLGKYLFFFSQTDRYKKWVKVMSTRSGQPGISGKEYETLEIPVPKLNEQERILSIINHTNDLVFSEKKGLEKLKLQKTALMQDLLTGKVRVDTLLN